MATEHNPPRWGQEYIFSISLPSQADPNLFQSNPTLAAGDVKISKDNGSFANLASLPSVAPASGVLVKIVVSATEMQADNIDIIFSDASGAEWCDTHINIQPTKWGVGVIVGTVQVVTGEAISSTGFPTDLPATVDDQYNGQVLTFIGNVTAAIKGLKVKVSDHAATNGVLQVTTMNQLPADGDMFVLT